MYFFMRSGWQVQFLEPDLKTSLPSKLTFSDPEKIKELAGLSSALHAAACLITGRALREETAR
jgi:hypothetical protein